MKTCGHMIHPNCLLRTVETEVEKYVDFEMICPMCRHYSNILLPSWDYSSEEFKISSVKDLMKLIRKGLNCEKTFLENFYSKVSLVGRVVRILKVLSHVKYFTVR